MKKIKYIISSLVLCLSATTAGVLCLDNVSASAEEKMTSATSYTLQEVSNDMFGEKEISQSGYLYNLDGSADYVYVCFATGGYAILYEDTLELMEYAQEGSFPYQINDGEKYYAGPGNYYQGTATQLQNTITGEALSLSTTERAAFSQNLRTQLSLGKSEVELQTESVLSPTAGGEELTSVPPIDEDNLISAGADAVYIENKDFFIKNERFGDNDYGTCGSVSVQLLLNYHNYYSDRRIIEPYYLNGGWKHKQQVDGFDIFDPNNYSIPEDNPNVCNNPNVNLEGEKGLVVGSNDDFYSAIIKLVEPNLTGSNIEDQRRGLSMILLQQLGTGSFSITSGESVVEMVAHILQDRPIKIGINTVEIGTPIREFKHAVVGYGVQYYTYSGSDENYLGFIANFGWKNSEATNIWINSAWCANYIAVNINHTHSYSEVDVYTDYLYQNRRCVCGHRIVEENHIFTTTDIGEDQIQIDGAEQTVTGKLIIPQTINGRTVTAIGKAAFKDETQITEVVLPETVISIGSMAFKGCTSLTTIRGMKAVVAIGMEAFRDCSALTSVLGMESVVNIGNYAFAYCTALTSITVPVTLQNIYMGAFWGATNLVTFKIKENGEPQLTTIKSSAFNGCSKLANFGVVSTNYLNLPSSVTTIEASAFRGTAFKFIAIGANVSTIGDAAFSNMTGLIDIYVDDANWRYADVNSTLYDYWEGSLIKFSSAKGSTSFTVPETVNGVPITRIELSAFDGASNLVTVDLGNVTYIERNAFLNCSALTTFTSTDKLETIEEFALDGTAFYNQAGDFVSLGEVLYRYKGTASVLNATDFPTGVTRFMRYAFYMNTNLQTVNLPTTTEYIGDNAFYNCTNLTAVRYTGETLPEVGSNSFLGLADGFKFYCAQSLIDSVTETSAWYAYVDIMAPIE